MANPSHDKGNVAELLRIGGQMANVMFNFSQLPGERITYHQTEVMDSLRKQWDAAVRATPPSPSTAPEVDERAAFEAWVTRLAPGHPLARDPNGRYSADCNEWAWDGWQASALASRPAEVDDEGLLPLPDQYVELSPFPGRKYFTAEQYRQGQRDAVAEDRARRGDRS